MQQQATVTWSGEGMRFEGRSASGHSVAIDGDRAAGASPMELVELALGGCSSIDVVLILQKMRQEITGCQCVLSATRRDEAPRIFTALHARFIVTGRGLEAAKVERAVALSLEKYCSVALSLHPDIAVTSSFEVVEAA